MKPIQRTYKFELIPTKEQAELLAKHFGCVRFVYNYFLDQRKKSYDQTGKADNYHAQAKALTGLKKEEDTHWLKEVNSQSLQYSLKCLEAAYKNFFTGRTKFPRFKSKKGKTTFHVPQSIKLEGERLYIPKFRNGIKVIQHR